MSLQEFWFPSLIIKSKLKKKRETQKTLLNPEASWERAGYHYFLWLIFAKASILHSLLSKIFSDTQIYYKMPKKMGVNSKAEAARARKSAAEAERKDREAREKEEQYWREAEGPKSKAIKKREEEAEKRAEAAARKAEARRQAEMEEKEIEKALKKPDKKANRVSIPVPKVTESELQKRKEEQQAEMAKKADEAKKRQSRTAAEEEYERMVLVTNTNRDDSLIEASSVEEAIAQMSVADNLPPDRHPERRLKASFKVHYIALLNYKLFSSLDLEDIIV